MTIWLVTWSKALVKNVAKVEAKATVRSLQAAPIATPTKFCSAIKHSMYLEGSTVFIFSENVEFFMSPSRAMTRELFCAILTKALP